MAEYGVATISVLMPHRSLRPRAADPPRPWNTTRPSPINATHIGKRLAGKLHEPFERAGGGRAISPTSPDSTPEKPSNKAVRNGGEEGGGGEGTQSEEEVDAEARPGHSAGFGVSQEAPIRGSREWAAQAPNVDHVDLRQEPGAGKPHAGI